MRVRVVSPLWSLDRDLDYLVPESVSVKVGQRVLVPIGKQKNPELAVVTELLSGSDYATREVASVLPEPPVVDRQHLEFLNQVARRYCVSLGEVLGLAVPDYMPRAANSCTLSEELGPIDFDTPKSAVELTLPRSNFHSGALIPDWAAKTVQRARANYSKGASALVCVPEQSDIEILSLAFKVLAPEVAVVAQAESETKSLRYLRYRAAIAPGPKVVVTTRSGILWPISRLSMVVVHDELDDSLKEQSTPFYGTWEVALLRAQFGIEVLFASPYRSAHLERLVEIDFLNSVGIEEPPRQVEFSRPEEIQSKSVIPFLKKCATKGTVLVLTTRKGSNAAMLCSQCWTAKLCDRCSGPIWVNREGSAECKICALPLSGSCRSCGGFRFSPGKTGASRIASDIGKALPGNRVIELEHGSESSVRSKPQQIVVATVGAAPYLAEGYSGLLVFDGSAWVGSSHPTAELIAHRDWLGAIELLAPTAPVYIRNCDPNWGQRFATGQYLKAALEAVHSSREAGLYPWSKYLKLECDSHAVDQAANELTSFGATILKISKQENRSEILANYKAGDSLRIADGMRPWVKLQKSTSGTRKRRAVSIEFDHEAWR